MVTLGLRTLCEWYRIKASFGAAGGRDSGGPFAKGATNAQTGPGIWNRDRRSTGKGAEEWNSRGGSSPGWL
jgi:hypothetical protein